MKGVSVGLLTVLVLLAGVLVSARGRMMLQANDEAVQPLSSASLGCIRESPILFSSNYNGNQVNAYDVRGGKALGGVLPPEANSTIRGPNGILIYKDLLFVANQNIGTQDRGAVLAFNVPGAAKTGELSAADLPFLRAGIDPVPHYDANAPLGPRGIAIGGPRPLLYIADAAGAVLAFEADPPYKFTGTVDNTGNAFLLGGKSPYRPGGVVFGPDGLLYVSIRSFADALFGAILRYDVSMPPGVFKDVFATNAGEGCARHLHRCEGMSWGPDGRLYVSAFAANKDNLETAAEEPSNVDRVLVFDEEGICKDWIELDTAQEIAREERHCTNMPIFGPGFELYTPILGSGSPGPHGEIRAYSARNEGTPYRVVRLSDGASMPLYSTFARSHPGTFAYQCAQQGDTPAAGAASH